MQSGWKNSNIVSGVLCERKMNVKIKGIVPECLQDSGKTGIGVWGRDMDIAAGTGE